MAKKQFEEDWPTEEEFKAEEEADAILEAECDCTGECHSCAGDCNCNQHKNEKNCSSNAKNTKNNAKTSQNNEKIKELEAKTQEYLNMARTVQAEFDNYRKRNLDAVKNARDEGKSSVITSILPCADAIDRAITMTTDKATLEGLQMVQNKFTEVLKSLGVEKYNSLGCKFNPNEHNAICAAASSEESGTIIQVVEEGYKMNGKTIRFAQVIVAK